MLYNVDYHIIDRCNLNCACCDHFSSLVPPRDKGKSIEQITADLTLLSKIKSEIGALSLLGGEPTLHPQLSKILRIARKNLPDTVIHVVTNATKYNEFYRWKDSLMETNIDVVVSMYPYCKDYKERLEIIKKTLEPEVRVGVIDLAGNIGFNYGFLANNSEPITEEEISQCERKFWCCQLKDGKMYICHFAAQFNRLKDYFGDAVHFDLDGKEFFDLNGDITVEQFWDFVYNARPSICKRCIDVKKGGAGGERIPWSITKKDINEWLIN